MSFEIVTPTFDRIDNVTVFTRPSTIEDFQALKTMSKEDLKSLGVGIWNETDERIHYLFPKEWYDSIPNGLEIAVIDDTLEPFEHGKTDDDTRFGMLAYGFLVPKA